MWKKSLQNIKPSSEIDVEDDVTMEEHDPTLISPTKCDHKPRRPTEVEEKNNFEAEGIEVQSGFCTRQDKC